VTLVEFAIIGVFELIITLASSVVQPLESGSFIFTGIYLVAAGLFYWLWVSIRPKPAVA
jgi:sulfite exporter TauE/SafE